MNEEDRRELIARQHRALYGNESSPYYEGSNFGDESHTPRPANPNSGNTSAGGRGPSPRGYDAFATGQSQGQPTITDSATQLNASDSTQKGPSPNPQQQRSRADSTASPASNPPGQNFSLFESAAQQQSSRTSTSSPGGSPPRQSKTSAPGVAPIGTRPAQNPTSNPAATKAPSPSPLSYGFSTENLSAHSNNNNERSTSAASNPTSGNKDSAMGAWGSGSGVWGNNKSSLQASVWG